MKKRMSDRTKVLIYLAYAIAIVMFLTALHSWGVIR